MGRKEYVVRFCGSSVSTKDAYVKKKKTIQNKEGPQFIFKGVRECSRFGGKWLAILFDN